MQAYVPNQFLYPSLSPIMYAESLLECIPLLGARLLSISCTPVDINVDVDFATCSFDKEPASPCKYTMRSTIFHSSKNMAPQIKKKDSIMLKS